jgi:putative DNA methylase
MCRSQKAVRQSPMRLERLKWGLSPESRGRWEALAAGTLTLDPAEPADMAILRMALLDFIADFANWDNSTVPAYLETARRVTGVAHASLSEAPFRLPLSFAKLSAHLAEEAKAKAEGSKVVFGGVGEWMDALDQQLADLPRPLVVDPFAGGGSIPLEALRVGADAIASDLNPIPVLLNKIVLEYIPKYGKRLAEEVRKWGRLDSNGS